MAGNSQRQGAIRKSKKGAQVGSGGQRRRALEGKGPTPPAEERKGHAAARRSAAADRRGQAAGAEAAGGRPAAGRPVAGRTAGGRPAGARTAGGRTAAARPTGGRTAGARSKQARDTQAPELLVGRNPVAEALRAKIPATALYLAQGLDNDERVTEAIRIAGNRGLALLEVSRAELDRRTGGILHQGIALQVPPFVYHELPDLLREAGEAGVPPLLVALDGVTDPRNLGAVIRSALAFGAQGVIVPERRSAGVTATAWRTSAGAAARLPVAQVTNLVRSLRDCRDAGLFVLGLDADGSTALDDLELATEPVVVVVGSEGRGLSRLVGETCDLTVSIPMAAAAESLNASVAAAVTLAEIARRRRVAL